MPKVPLTPPTPVYAAYVGSRFQWAMIGDYPEAPESPIAPSIPSLARLAASSRELAESSELGTSGDNL